MSDAPTPGQIAYEAYWQVHKTDGHIHLGVPFARLPAITRQSWEAAAQAVREEQEPRAGSILSRAEFEHLLNCLANQKFLHEMAEPLRHDTQAIIDIAWRRGMDWLAQGTPQEETPHG